jgi:hypothetical protein
MVATSFLGKTGGYDNTYGYGGLSSSSYGGYPLGSYSGYPGYGYSGYPSYGYSGYPGYGYSSYPSSSYGYGIGFGANRFGSISPGFGNYELFILINELSKLFHLLFKGNFGYGYGTNPMYSMYGNSGYYPYRSNSYSLNYGSYNYPYYDRPYNYGSYSSSSSSKS